jgi:hypothetical protein
VHDIFCSSIKVLSSHRIFSFLMYVTASQASSGNVLTCVFMYFPSLYTCWIVTQNLPDSDNRNVTILGDHFFPNHDDSSVEKVFILESGISFIVTEFFTKFENLLDFEIHNSGLTRIQSHSFAKASKLETIKIDFGVLRTIEANAFLGASSVKFLDLKLNDIRDLHEDSFNGLVSLQTLMMENNVVRNLPANLFRSMVNLESVSMANNYINTLDGKLFVNSPKIVSIDFTRNQIIEVGDEIIDGLDNLELFNLMRNRCVDNAWVVDDITLKDDIRNGMKVCFDNFNAVKRTRVEIRGKMMISDDYDNEIVSF